MSKARRSGTACLSGDGPNVLRLQGAVLLCVGPDALCCTAVCCLASFVGVPVVPAVRRRRREPGSTEPTIRNTVYSSCLVYMVSMVSSSQ